VRLRLLQGLAFFVAIFSFGLFSVRPNIERYLPGNPMPDAFNGLNNAMPVFMLFITATILVVLWIERKRQHVLLVPLLFGPSACFARWCLTENFNDPTWFHLFALTIMGMMVSCAVVVVLLIAPRKQQNKTMDAKCSIERF
jgi:uncharacterized membrane protein